MLGYSVLRPKKQYIRDRLTASPRKGPDRSAYLSAAASSPLALVLAAGFLATDFLAAGFFSVAFFLVVFFAVAFFVVTFFVVVFLAGDLFFESTSAVSASASEYSN